MKRKPKKPRGATNAGRRAKSQRRAALANPRGLQAAVELYQAGRFFEARTACRHALEADPHWAEAHHLFGLIAYRLGDTHQAIDQIRRATQLKPDYAAAHNDLGNVLSGAGREAEAEAAYRDALSVDPSFSQAHKNLGIVLKNLGRLEEAIACYEQAIALEPRDADAHGGLAAVLKKAGKYNEAADSCRRVIALDPGRTETYQQLCASLRHAGRLDETKEVFEQWLQHDPDNPVAKHMAAAFSAAEGPSRASDQYVCQVFDRFASTFDEQLAGLDYRGPQLMAESLGQQYAVPEGILDVLDAGCGTGLCGPTLRPYARKLVGVDLSRAMLENARHRGVFDEFVEAELTSYLNDHRETYDLIVASDTFHYFGDLEPVFEAAGQALRPGGVLIFTLERDESDSLPAGCRLNPNGRYSHSESYAKRCLAASGLRLQSISVATLRMEAGRPVAVLLVRCVRAK